MSYYTKTKELNKQRGQKIAEILAEMQMWEKAQNSHSTQTEQDEATLLALQTYQETSEIQSFCNAYDGLKFA